MTAYEQRSYPGAAADTLLNADVTSGATSFSVTPGTGTGYPDGSSGPFFVIIDWDNSKAEKVRCSGRVNDTFTVAGSGGGRGQDGTSAQSHNANAKVRAVITATDLQETNRAAAQTIGQVTTKGDLLTGSGANTLARTAAGANGTIPIYDSTQPGGIRAGANPSLVGATLDGTSTLGGVSGTVLGGARTPYAATFTNFTQGNAAVITRYRQIGKTVEFAVTVVPGSTSAYSGIVSVSLPVQAASYPQNVLAVFWNGTSNDMGIAQLLASATTASLFCHLTTGSSALGNYQGTSLGVVVSSAVAGNWNVYGTYEAA